MNKFLFAVSTLISPLVLSSLASAASFCTYAHCFSVGETVVVQVAQGRTTGTIQRIDGDGYTIVQTGSGFSNYQGSIQQVLWSLNTLDGFNVGQTVAVQVAQGRTTGVIQRIDADGYTIVQTGSGFSNYTGPISGLISIENGTYVQGRRHPVSIHVGDTVVVQVAQGRTTGTVQRIDGDDFVIVQTGSGFSNYQGPASNILTIVPASHGFRTGETVAVTVAQGRTTGTILRIDSDGHVIVQTGSGFSNYTGDIRALRHILNTLNGFSVGETVVVQVAQGRTQGTILRIESDGYVVVQTGSGYSNYTGSISGLIHSF